MFLKDKRNGHMVDIDDTPELTNLFHTKIMGSYQVGEELQDPEEFNKTDLVFLSGEALPKCWTDPKYRQFESHH